MHRLKVTILIPAYNEERTILTLLQKVKASTVKGVSFEIIVVNDGSQDRTLDILEAHPDLYTKLISLKKNGGKGKAVKAGLKAASGEYILFQDADLEYDPKEYSNLLQPVLEWNADVVIGSRFLAPHLSRVHYFWNKVGNKVITGAYNILFNRTCTDIYSCYLLFRKELLNPDHLETNGFEQQAEILSLISSKAKSFYEVAISYHGRTVEEGKKIKAEDGIRVLWVLLRKRFF